MSHIPRWLLVAAALETIALPIVTAHTLVLHPDWVRPTGIQGIGDPAVGMILGLIALTTIPSIRLSISLLRSARASRRISVLAEFGHRAEVRGLSYVRIPGSHVSFFTVGVWRPTIYATEGAERELSPGSFWAALLHERAHSRRGDALSLTLLNAVERSLDFLPWSATTLGQLRLWMERTADVDALAAGASRRDLFDAIVAASSWSPGRSAAGLSGAGAEQRLRWLADEDEGFCFPGRQTLGLLGSIAVPPAVAHVVPWIGFVCAACVAHLIH